MLEGRMSSVCQKRVKAGAPGMEAANGLGLKISESPP